ncbi:putative ABC transporter, substrate-binding protein [Nocardia nova SH22a]|uniref:Putative ABC transporter, substrate-binding protein n=1 Tax=Nocardia nova SH22a TaxID=1415166 RepID=W5TKX8_9NOCA|nr:ABC transporter substrate-binding protein [Nocardia nova]AHH17856.1 putative ABC transporter, substrate-binding protein [Nocardia nova SH22a]
MPTFSKPAPFRRTRRRRIAAIALAAVAALLAGACGGAGTDSGPSGEGRDPVRGGTLRIAFFPDNAAFPCIDPFQVYWIEHRSLIRNFADSLTDQNPETGAIVPWLATGWQISPDGLEYTFTLRDGVTFADGAPLDAAAVKANFDAFLDLRRQTNGTVFGASYIVGLESAEVVDGRTVRFHFSRPNSSFLQATSTTNLALLSPASLRNTPQQRCQGGVVGSGPFVLDKYVPGESVSLSRRTGHHWGSALSKNTGEAYLDGVRVSYVAEDSVRTGDLVAGQIDIAWPRNPFTVEDRQLISRSGAYVRSRPLPGVSYTLYPNVSQGRPLADDRVRAALYHAIDVKSYAATVFGSDYPPVAGPFDSTTPYFASQAAKLNYDPQEAGRLLDAAGWRIAPGDRYRSKDGKRLTLTQLISTASPGAELFQDQLRQVGIDLQLKVVTTAERPGAIAGGQYDLLESYFTRADPGALQYILDEQLANSKALARNAQKPETAARVRDLFTQAVQAGDEAQRSRIYTELQNVLIDNGVTFPLFERLQYAGIRNQVNGFRFTSESFLALDDTWIQP